MVGLASLEAPARTVVPEPAAVEEGGEEEEDVDALEARTDL